MYRLDDWKEALQYILDNYGDTRESLAPKLGYDSRQGLQYLIQWYRAGEYEKIRKLRRTLIVGFANGMRSK